jgi:hypothetical protein
MQAHFWWTLKNDSSSLANSETKAPSNCLLNWTLVQWYTQVPAHICHPTPKMFPPKCPKHTPVCAHICHPTPPRQNSCLWLFISPIPRHDSPCCVVTGSAKPSPSPSPLRSASLDRDESCDGTTSSSSPRCHPSLAPLTPLSHLAHPLHHLAHPHHHLVEIWCVTSTTPMIVQSCLLKLLDGSDDLFLEAYWKLLGRFYLWHLRTY